jgi:glycosyltransferase involved in cell wall biosynthesis
MLSLFTKAILPHQLKKESLNKPKVSIITICFNSGKTIEDTLVSVRNQDYPNIEHVIIDGLSKDNTLEVVARNQHPGIVLLSEKDHGLYDALNKGFQLCTGDIIGVLHSDDYLAGNSVISSLVAMFEQHPEVEAVSTSVNIYKPERPEKPYRVYDATNFKTWQFRIGIQPPHPGFYIKRSVFQKVGFFNSSYKISGDFDWLYKVIIEEKTPVYYTDFVVVSMRDGGVSSSGFESKKLMNRENLRVLKSHGVYSNKFLIYLKYFWKVFQLRF